MTRDQDTGLVSDLGRVLVERDSQKGILIGKGGQMLQEIGSRARPELERAARGEGLPATCA